jgi:predicted Rossmann-fold nucleotide-binding protein
MTWQQLGFHQKPIGLLNTCGFFDPLLACFDSFIAEVGGLGCDGVRW